MFRLKSLSRLFSVGLFTACATFVTFRSSRCLEKFWSKPQHVEFMFNPINDENLPFPSLTFCKEIGKNLEIQDLKNNISKVVVRTHEHIFNNQANFINYTKPFGISIENRGKCVNMNLSKKVIKKKPRKIFIIWKNSSLENLKLFVHHPLNSWPVLPVKKYLYFYPLYLI